MVTIAVRYPNKLAFLFQGGLAGYYLSLDANLEFSGMRSTYYAFAYLNGNLIYGSYVGGAVAGHRLFNSGDIAASNDQSLPVKRSGFHLYPGAEIVANTSMAANPILEPNNVIWAYGNLVEGPHPCNFGGAAVFARREQFSPCSKDFYSSSLLLGCDGPGIGESYTPLLIANSATPTQYAGMYDQIGREGPLHAPAMITANGPHSGGLLFGTAPLPPSEQQYGNVIRVLQANTIYSPVLPPDQWELQKFCVLCMPHGNAGDKAAIVFDPNEGVYTANCGFEAKYLVANRSDTPASSNPPAPFSCSPGELWSDGTYLYVGLAGNQVKRVLLSSW